MSGDAAEGRRPDDQPPEESIARTWLRAVRAYSYPASIVPVVVGGVYAWYASGRFDPRLFLAALVAGVLYHTGCNLINDVYDHRHGVDRPGTYGGSGVLVDGSLTPGSMMTAAWLCLAAGTVIGLYFVWLHGWPMLALGVAGLLAAIFYTATPGEATAGSAKYHALGEPLVFLMMGTGMVLGGYLVIAGELTWAAAAVSLPVGFVVAAILQANDTRDISDDRQAGILTLAILAGPGGARALYSGLLLGAYISVVALVATGVLPWPALAPLLTLPLAWRLHRRFWDTHHRHAPDEDGAALVGTVESTAQLHLLFGLLLAVGILTGGWLG